MDSSLHLIKIQFDLKKKKEVVVASNDGVKQRENIKPHPPSKGKSTYHN